MWAVVGRVNNERVLGDAQFVEVVEQRADRRGSQADTAYDADHLRKTIATKGALTVISNNPSRVLDKHLYA